MIELFDTHCHLFERGFHGKYGFLLGAQGEELAAYERFRSEFSITKSLVVGYEEADRYRGNNAYINELSATRPWLVPLRFVGRGGAVKAGEFVSLYVGDAASAVDASRVLAAAHDAGSPPAIVSLNAGPEAIAALSPTIRRMDHTWFLLSHLGMPGPVVSRDAALERLAPLLELAGVEQVSVKLSGQYAASAAGYPHADAQVLVDEIARAFGIPALVWGSDFSPCLEYVSFDEAIHCLLPRSVSAQERAEILCGNATRMFTTYREAAA